MIKKHFEYIIKRVIINISILISFIIDAIKYSNKSETANIGSIIVFILSDFGDVVLATPVFKNLRLNYPQAHITAVVGGWGKAILENNNAVDEIVVYHSKIAGAGKSQDKPLRSMRDVINEINFRHYDLIVDLRGDILSNIYAAISDARIRVSRGSLRVRQSLIGKLFKMECCAPMAHEVDLYLSILTPLKIKLLSKQLEYTCSKNEIEFIQQYLTSKDINIDDKIAVIHPGAAWVHRRWGVERFADIADRLSLQGWKVFVIGSRDEKVIGDTIEKMSKSDIIVTNGDLDIRQLAALISKAGIFIGNDSGPMHLASALSVPTVGLFGPNTPDKFGPCGKPSIAVYKKMECSPCKQFQCAHMNDSCMNKISADEVWQAILDVQTQKT